MLKELLGLALCGWSMPVLALQDSAAEPPPTGGPENATAAEKPETPAVGNEAPKAQASGAGELCASPNRRYGCWFSIQVAPAIISDGPFGSESPTTDSTAVSWTFIALEPLAPGLDFQIKAGPAVTVDSDNDSEESSTLSASFELQASEPISYLRPFAGFGIEFAYPNFFGEGNWTNHTFQAGFRFERKYNPVTATATFNPTIVESTRDLGDYFALPISGGLRIPLIPDRATVRLDAAIERRWYNDPDPAFGTERRDWRFNAYAGLDLSAWFNRMIVPRGHKPLPIFSDFVIGARWIEIWSNHTTRDQSAFRVLPVMSIRIPFRQPTD